MAAIVDGLAEGVNLTRFAGGAEGHHESFFLRANHPSRPLAIWIRYRIFSPAGRPGDAVGELWAIYFDGAADSFPEVATARFRLGPFWTRRSRRWSCATPGRTCADGIVARDPRARPVRLFRLDLRLGKRRHLDRGPHIGAGQRVRRPALHQPAGWRKGLPQQQDCVVPRAGGRSAYRPARGPGDAFARGVRNPLRRVMPRHYADGMTRAVGRTGQ